MKIFPFGPNATEVMLYGTVSYDLKEGGSASKDWAARAELVKGEQGWKLGVYQVYLVSCWNCLLVGVVLMGTGYGCAEVKVDFVREGACDQLKDFFRILLGTS